MLQFTLYQQFARITLSSAAQSTDNPLGGGANCWWTACEPKVLYNDLRTCLSSYQQLLRIMFSSADEGLGV